LHFPRNERRRCLNFTALPDPPTDTVLSAQGLIHEGLVVQSLRKNILRCPLFNLLLNKLKSSIYILDVSLLVKKNANVFNGRPKDHFLLKVFHCRSCKRDMLIKFLGAGLSIDLSNELFEEPLLCLEV
jgi:hypothetical protein